MISVELLEKEKKDKIKSEGENASGVDIGPFVKDLCLTFSHLTYYQPTHPVTVKQMQEAWSELLPVLDKIADVSLSMVEGKLLFFGTPVEEKNSSVLKFLKHFEVLCIRSIKFNRGLTYEEFTAFFIFLCRDLQAINDAGGADKILKDKNIRNISFNTFVYREVTEEELVNKKAEIRSGKKSSGADTPKPPRKRSKSFKPLAIRIQKTLDTEFNEIREIDRIRLLDYLNNVFVREIRKLEEQNIELQHKLEGVENVFENTNIGFIIFDGNQNILFVKNGYKFPFNLELNKPPPVEFQEQLEKNKDVSSFMIGEVSIVHISREPEQFKSILFQF